MFGTCMCTGLAQRLVSIDTVSCLPPSFVQYFKMAKEEEALVDIGGIGEIETEKMLSRV